MSAWQENPYYSGRERAALIWAEAVTKFDISGAVYSQAKEHFSDEELIDLTLAITSINTWNHINLAFPTTPGSYTVGKFG